LRLERQFAKIISLILKMKFMHSVPLDLNLLTVFRALLRSESVTLAASHLNLTQSAVSHALNRLRLQFGDPLFLRAGGRMRTTPRALQIAPKIEEALSLIEGTLGGAFDPRLIRRDFHLGLVNFGALYLIPALVGRLATEAPRARVTADYLQPEAAARRLRTGEIDLAIGVFDRMCEEWEATPLFDDRIALIAAKSNRKVGSRVTAAGLAKLDHVQVPLPERYDSELLQAGIRRRFAASVDDVLSGLFAVARTNCVALVPGTVAKIYREVCALKILTPPVRLSPFRVDLVRESRTASDPEQRWLVEQITDLAGELGNAVGTAISAQPRRVAA
jgi:DNA-binding transcriptional LysR family regulator